jgi:hypothetical protein
MGLLEPIDYEKAIRDLAAIRRRRRITGFLRRLDPRPTSPGQVLLLGLALAVVGWLVPVAHVASLVGLALLALGFVSGLIQPRGRRVKWRNRDIDLPPNENLGTRIYRILYRT